MFNIMIKAAPDDFEYPTKSDNKIEVIKLTCQIDISYCAFQLAWQEVYQRHGNLVWPKDIIMSCIPIDIIHYFGAVLRGNFLVGKNKDIDEYWITFVDMKSDEPIKMIFYSPGA